MPTFDLRTLVTYRARRFQELTTALNAELIAAAVTRYNAEWGPRRLGRLATEPLPTAATRLTAFRGRLGLLIEHALGVLMDEALAVDYGVALRMSAEVVNKYPDFYLRLAGGEPTLRIDFKVLHDESAEKSARITEPVTELRATDDLLLYAAWRWSRIRLYGTEVVFPEVTEAIAVSAIEVARERDRNLAIRGGSLTAAGEPLTVSGLRDTNYGKINRIVHSTRRTAPDLDPGVRAFLEFVDRVLPQDAQQTD